MIKRIGIIVYKYLIAFGINPIFTLLGIKNIFGYIREYIKLQGKDKNFPIYLNNPQLHDKGDNSGIANGHYFHQDLLVAQKIFKTNPEIHVDVGSRVDGFVAHVASYRDIEVFDIRPLENNVNNITFKQLDLMQDIPEKYHNYTDSLSCLHTIEHFGLGRYGDNIDISGHKKGFTQLHKLLKQGGIFYFSTPIGKKQRIEFNAHRIFSLPYLLDMIDPLYEIISFSYVDDKGDLHNNIEFNSNLGKNTFGLNYGCGIFELRKK